MEGEEGITARTRSLEMSSRTSMTSRALARLLSASVGGILTGNPATGGGLSRWGDEKGSGFGMWFVVDCGVADRPFTTRWVF